MRSRAAWIALFRQALVFLAGTLVGLAVDLSLYAILVSLGLIPALANALSSATAVVVMYFVSSRYAFKSRGGPLTVVLFFGWYALAIVGVSALIQWGVDGLGLQFFIAKLLSLPISFTANFFAVRAIFHFSGRPHAPVAESEPAADTVGLPE